MPSILSKPRRWASKFTGTTKQRGLDLTTTAKQKGLDLTTTAKQKGLDLPPLQSRHPLHPPFQSETAALLGKACGLVFSLAGATIASPPAAPSSRPPSAGAGSDSSVRGSSVYRSNSSSSFSEDYDDGFRILDLFQDAETGSDGGRADDNQLDVDDLGLDDEGYVVLPTPEDEGREIREIMEGMPPSVPRHLREGSWTRPAEDEDQVDDAEDGEEMEQIITRGLSVLSDSHTPSSGGRKRRNAMDIDRQRAEFQYVPMTLEENKSMPSTVHGCGSTKQEHGYGRIKQESALGTTVMGRGLRQVEGWAGTARERLEGLGRRL